MKRTKRLRRVQVNAEGAGVVSHAGVGLLRELAEASGLVDGVSEALRDSYRGTPVHAPGRVFTDLAVAVADGADAISGIGVLGDRQELFGPVASMPTTWRVLDRIDAAGLDRVRRARIQEIPVRTSGSRQFRTAADQRNTIRAPAGRLANAPGSRRRPTSIGVGRHRASD